MARDSAKPDIRTVAPPEGVDPEVFARRVRVLHGTGLPWYNASRLARLEFLGVRPRIPDTPDYD